MQQRPALELTQEDIRYLEERLGEPEGLDKLELRLAEDWKKAGCSLAVSYTHLGQSMLLIRQLRN